MVGAGAFGAYYAFQPQPIGVDIAKVEKGTLVVTIDDEGIVRVKDTYQISTPIGGDVQRIPFIIGDHVEKNAIVASIEPQLSGFLDERTLLETQAGVRTAEAAVTSAKTDVAGAQSELRHWQGEANRSKQLMDRGLASEQVYEQTLFQLKRQGVLLATLEATLELRKRQLEQAQARLIEPNGSKDRAVSYKIKAPVGGQVLEIANESARSLPAGSHLLTIGDPANLEVIVALLSSDAVRIKVGAPAILSGWGQDIELEAKVKRIEPIGFTKISALGIEEQRVRVHLEILSEPELWQNLGHLYKVFVSIEEQRVENTLLVPSSALFRDKDQWAVFSLEGENAKLLHLTLGAQDSKFAEVKEGIKENTQVVLHPNDKIEDGSLLVDRMTLLK